MDVLIHEDGKRLVIRGWHRDHFILLSGIPGNKRWVGRDLVLHPTGASIQYIIDNFPTASWDEQSKARQEEYLQTQLIGEQTSALKKAALDELECDWDGFFTVPYAHQLRWFTLSRDRRAFGLFFEQGCGKSKVVIDTAHYLFQNKSIEALVIIAPNNVHRNWIDTEVPAHLHPRVKWAGFLYTAKLTTKKIDEVIRQAQKAHQEGKLVVFAFNIEGFTSDKAKQALEKVLVNWKCMGVIDESSRIRTPGAKRTKYLQSLRERFLFRRILSGTPITKGPENIYSQLAWLDPDILGYTSFYTFRNHYCIMGGYQGHQIVGYKNMAELTRKMDGHSARVLKKDCLDLPPKIYKRMPFELSKEQLEAYTSMANDFVAKYNDEEIVAQIALAQITRLQQISSGWWPSSIDEDGNESDKTIFKPFPDNPRLDALKTILEDTEGKAIIWTHFTSNIDLICKELGDKAVRFDGQVSSNQRVANMKRFKEDPQCLYFVAHPMAAGIGLTLTEADTAIYYTNQYDLELREQSEDRNHRIGTLNPVVYWDLEAIKTIDRKITNSLRKKKSVAEAVLGDPKSFFLNVMDETEGG